MNNLTNKELAVGVFSAINKRDFTEFESYIADDLTFDFPGVDQIKGAKRVILFFNVLFRKYKVLQFHVSDVVSDDKKACVKWENSGEEKDGALYSNSGLTWFYFENGKINFMSDYFKDTSFTK
jgi:ketosteroid isomerase-like protein